MKNLIQLIQIQTDTVSLQSAQYWGVHLIYIAYFVLRAYTHNKKHACWIASLQWQLNSILTVKVFRQIMTNMHWPLPEPGVSKHNAIWSPGKSTYQLWAPKPCRRIGEQADLMLSSYMRRESKSTFGCVCLVNKCKKLTACCKFNWDSISNRTATNFHNLKQMLK